MVIKLRLENNGQSVEISNKLPKGFLREKGLSGLGIAPTQLSIREGAADGGRFRRSRRGPRDIDLPIAFNGEDADEVRGFMRDFVRILNDRWTTPYLYITYPDGEEQFTEVHYAAGANHVYGETTNGRTYAKWPVTLRAPSPYFTSTQVIDFNLTNTNAGRGLIKQTSLSKLRVSSSSAIGTITVDNPGDVEAYPLWLLRGPAAFFQASIGTQGFRYDEPLTFANQITVDTQTKTVVDSTGANRYEDLAAAPKLFAIPPGRSTLNILMDGVDATSRVLFNFQPRYEVVF
uniref:Tail protein n=1 Tax=Micrococcus phage Kurnik TaxID=3092208 RepID=A0AAU6R690_9CAUD